MNDNSKSDASVDTNQYEIVCPQCRAPVVSVDGSAVAGVLLDDFEHVCGFRGVISWSSPLMSAPRAVRSHNNYPINGESKDRSDPTICPCCGANSLEQILCDRELSFSAGPFDVVSLMAYRCSDGHLFLIPNGVVATQLSAVEILV